MHHIEAILIIHQRDHVSPRAHMVLDPFILTL